MHCTLNVDAVDIFLVKPQTDKFCLIVPLPSRQSRNSYQAPPTSVDSSDWKLIPVFLIVWVQGRNAEDSFEAALSKCNWCWQRRRKDKLPVGSKLLWPVSNFGRFVEVFKVQGCLNDGLWSLKCGTFPVVNGFRWVSWHAIPARIQLCMPNARCPCCPWKTLLLQAVMWTIAFLKVYEFHPCPFRSAIQSSGSVLNGFHKSTFYLRSLKRDHFPEIEDCSKTERVTR